MSNPVKSFGYIQYYRSSSLDLLKALAILSDTIVRRSAVDGPMDLKPYWKSEKRPHFSCFLVIFGKPPAGITVGKTKLASE